MVKTSPSNAERAGSIPGQGAKSPHDSRPKNQNIKQKQYCNKFNKDSKTGPYQKKNLKKKKKVTTERLKIFNSKEWGRRELRVRFSTSNCPLPCCFNFNFHEIKSIILLSSSSQSPSKNIERYTACFHQNM